MKKIVLMGFVSMFVCMLLLSPVHAGEEIQLAAVMTESGSDKLTVNKKLYAIGEGSTGGVFRSRNKDSNFDYAVIGGVMVVLLGVIVEGGADSTSSH